jgi:glutaredoxin
MNAERATPTTAQTQFHKQECTVRGMQRTWAGYLAGIALLVYFRNWIGLLLWLPLVPILKWVYMQLFPRFSRFIGYGRVDDKLPADVRPSHAVVTFYSALGCPFCPIVLQRLEVLQKTMGFTLEKIDVTLKPQLLSSKGIRSVPVVEVGENRLVGHATTEQLAQLIGSSKESEPARAA